MPARRPLFVTVLVTGLLVASFGTVTGSAVAQTPPQCPVVVENTHLETDCVGPMVVAADDVNINLGGHQIICSNPNADGIVMVNRTRVHIENGHVHSCRNAVHVVGGGNHALANLHLDGNNTGVRLLRTVGNVVREIEAINNQLGVLVQTSNDNLLRNINASNNANSGVYLTRASVSEASPAGNRLQRLVVNNNAIHGMVLDFQSDNNVITASRAEGNGRIGMYLWGANNRVEGNRFTGSLGTFPSPANGNGALVVFTGSVANSILGNVFSGNRQDGLEVWGNSNVIRGNVADDNGGDGITAGAVPEGPLGIGNTYQANSAFGNGGFDLADYPPGACTLNVWTSNRGKTLYNGCEDD